MEVVKKKGPSFKILNSLTLEDLKKKETVLIESRLLVFIDSNYSIK